MKLLLDTHILLWSLIDPVKLATNVADQLENPENELWLSPITSWEIMVLAERERIILDDGPEIWLKRMFRRLPFHRAPITHEVAIHSRCIDLPHKDPVDRFLAATAIVYDLTLVTADEHLLTAEVCRTMANS